MIVLSENLDSTLTEAVKQIKAGGVVVFPTDTVYGLGCSLFQTQSIQKLYAIKGREASKAIAVLCSDIEQLPSVAADVTQNAFHLVENCWPGALTIIVNKNPLIPQELSSLPTVGVRIPDHPFARALIRACGPMAVTSANLAGLPSGTSAQVVIDQLGSQVDIIIDGGQSPGGAASTVVDCTGPNPVILREGPISSEMINQYWHNKLS